MRLVLAILFFALLPGDSSIALSVTEVPTRPNFLPASQARLLEANDDGSLDGVAFLGTVEWTRGVDEEDSPTLIAKAVIPARNLGVELLIRKNFDPSLPASHLMEISFALPGTFIGEAVAQLSGVLLKDEERGQGVPLAGGSARIVGNSFLFALSASADDTAFNNSLLATRKWMDLAVVYKTGQRAMISLEKGNAAQALFEEVFAAWSADTEALDSAGLAVLVLPQ